MPNITTCSRCGTCYEESSEEWANVQTRLCGRCYMKGWRIKPQGGWFYAGPPCKTCDGTGRRIVNEVWGGTGVEYRTLEPCPDCATD